MPNAKRKLHFVEVKFDVGGNVIPQKKSKQEACQKIEFRPEAVKSLSSFGARQTNLWPPFTPIAPKPRPETPYPQKFAEKHASGLPDSENQSLKPKNTSSTAPIDENHVQASQKFKPECSDWIQRVKCYVGSKAPNRLQVSTWYFADLQHCSVSEKDLSRYDQNFVIAGVSPILINVSANGNYAVKALFRDVVTGTLKKDQDLDYLFAYFTEYVICPGLRSVPVAQSTLKRAWGFPFYRTDSKHCVVLHKPKNRKQTPGAHLFNVCGSCKKLHHELNAIAKKRVQNFAARTEKSSKCNWKFLSPKSQKKRWRNVTSHARRLEREVKRLKRLQVPLSADFSEQMQQITRRISSKFKDHLEDIFQEAETAGKGGIIREIWKKDVDDRRAFWKDQSLNGKRKGKQGSRWSAITYRIALAIFTRSPSAYEALKSFDILKLPSVSSLKQFKSAYNQPPGINLKHLEEASKSYAAYVEERIEQGYPKPMNTGVVIFDEVKVVMKVHWNSANNGFVGLAMTPQEMASLQDVYEVIKTPKPLKAGYQMQFLWRDLTSDFDVIGPYFSSNGGLESKFVISCLMASIHAFHINGFKTMAAVCDGASANLKAIKYLTTERSGAYGINDDPNVDEPHYVKPWMINPWTNEKLFFIPCPSHQLKSLIAALHSSRQGNGNQKKAFDLYGEHFGWQAIRDLWKREMQRAKNGKMRRVPRLCYRHVYRDCWTRLNVQPAKIMQQNQVITELLEYVEGNPPDSGSVSKTIEYLEACRQLCERGILSHEKISDDQSIILQNMTDGYAFFVGWADYAWAEEPNLTAANQKVFLAWQTWDLTRLMYYGFTEFCQCFLQRFPGYYIWPLRLNGSALETIFSQLKFSMNGQLSSVNYAPALATLKLKRRIHGQRGKFVYRKAPLYVRELPLKR